MGGDFAAGQKVLFATTCKTRKQHFACTRARRATRGPIFASATRQLDALALLFFHRGARACTSLYANYARGIEQKKFQNMLEILHIKIVNPREEFLISYSAHIRTYT